MRKEKTHYTKKAVRSSAIIFIMSMLAAFLAYLLRLLLARNLTPAEYGLFYSIFSLFGFMAIFRDFGLGSALVKHIAEFNVKKKYQQIKSSIVFVMGFQLVCSFIISSILFLLSDYLAINFFKEPSASLFIRIFALMFFIMPLERVLIYSLQGFQKMVYLSLDEFLRMLLIISATYVLFIYDKTAASPSIAYLFSQAILFVIYIPLFLKAWPLFLKTKTRITFDLSKKLLHFGLSFTVGLFGLYILSYTDTLVLTYFRPLEEVGWYNVAIPTSKLLLYFTNSLAIVLLPLSSELWAKRRIDKLKIGITLLHKYSFVMIMPLAMVMISFPKLIIKFFFGQAYVNGSIALQILSIGMVLYNVGFINNNILSGIGKPRESTKIIIVASLVNLVLNILFIPKFGIIAAASTTLFSYLIILIWSSAKIRHFIDVKIPYWAWAKSFIAGMSFIAAVWVIKRNLSYSDMAEFFICSIAAGIFYIITVLLFRIVDIKEIKDLIKSSL
ncbi:hypothetical protein COV19_05830 [Candidatus Woesearchaeota archaeon CG10_big_fil_rev_8_21_14_0_10_44_13]|nr:MAG: hypothetical protein COV19_05830 [Candidatus Woesearchaeota archaeon CG10_big_fil_rev_8_21_14_0_10_44_13]